MFSTSTFSIRSIDRQLFSISQKLKNQIIHYLEDHPDKLDDTFFAKIFETAQNWDKVFNNLQVPGRNE